MSNSLTQQLISAMLIGAVVLGGLHGKDLAKLTADHADGRVQASETQTAGNANSQAAKIAGELHNHIDKQTLHSLLKVSSGDSNTHVDSRSLRLLRSHRLVSPAEIRHSLLGDDILGLMLITAKTKPNRA